MLPAGTDKVVLVCSKTTLKAWDTKHLKITVPVQTEAITSHLEVEKIGGRRDMTDKDGQPTGKGNDIPSYSAVAIDE